MDSRNITFHFPNDLIRRIKIYAAEHDTTPNDFMRRLAEDRLNGKARNAALGLLEIAGRGPLFTGDPAAVSREELHERE